LPQRGHSRGVCAGSIEFGPAGWPSPPSVDSSKAARDARRAVE
jgi:hypothetical protein